MKCLMMDDLLLLALSPPPPTTLVVSSTPLDNITGLVCTLVDGSHRLVQNYELSVAIGKGGWKERIPSLRAMKG